ncbi:MAG: hypothetical protein ACLTMP_10625 [Eggerthella lenta]
MSMCPVCNNPSIAGSVACIAGSSCSDPQRFEPVSFGDDALLVAAAPRPLPTWRAAQTGVTYQLGDQALTIGRSAATTQRYDRVAQHASVEPADGATSSATPTRSTAYG